jgi:long-chain acyl-CoA synthetase
LFRDTVRKYSERDALGFAGQTPLTYRETSEKIMATMAYLEKMDVRPGDKVAILSMNMPNWGIVYLATTFMGAVVVPLLPDFHPDEVDNILEHSGAKVLFVSDGLRKKAENITGSQLEYTVGIENMSIISPVASDIRFDSREKYSKNYMVEEQDPAAIIYTSGTTGKSKGVMLSHKNIAFTALKTLKIQEVKPEDRLLSVLPLSHTYENTLGFIIPMICGASVFYLGKPPTPSILLPALKQVKPTLMLSVPMIIEKIYRNKILPAFQKKWHMRFLYKIPPVRRKLNEAAGKKLRQTFGGKLKFFGIGGAKLDKTVEKFLREARFPYAIGYGLTETSPLLAGANAENIKFQSTGPALEGVQLKIHNPDQHTGEGEIWAKGPNVMLGYYKQPELTREVITEDGWFKTGDLGVFDKNNYLYIKGRLKNMIVGDNGENIYPEEIESIINNFRHVAESIVVKKKGKLVAMVHFNKEEIALKYQELKTEIHNYIEDKVEDLKNELHHYINSKVNRFSRIQYVMLQNEPFQKTATHKIKRFLYNRNKE